MVGSTTRGLTLDIFCEMNPGQIIDYCIEYNNIMFERTNEETTREGTQKDFDSF